jgi:hypothetical protein
VTFHAPPQLNWCARHVRLNHSDDWREPCVSEEGHSLTSQIPAKCRVAYLVSCVRASKGVVK